MWTTALKSLAISGVATLLCSCAAGRGPAGEVIVGFDVAALPETAEEVAQAAAGFLPEPWRTIVGGGAALLFGGGAASIAAKRARDRENAAWDEASRESMLARLAFGGAGTVAPNPAAAEAKVTT